MQLLPLKKLPQIQPHLPNCLQNPHSTPLHHISHPPSPSPSQSPSPPPVLLKTLNLQTPKPNTTNSRLHNPHSLHPKLSNMTRLHQSMTAIGSRNKQPQTK
ncbi:hypothetical protein KC19_3G123500 [Ceratodon purpureus]|uniref:Uncharacterized protein n=1 Tax=Ceratodon purpureus TaxID=3225 RepID=A0A8T0IJ02_CERPU|nr:hypothetical protein KC19_3G123500 [Ceratodon purpureus]